MRYAHKQLYLLGICSDNNDCMDDDEKRVTMIDNLRMPAKLNWLYFDLDKLSAVFINF